MAIEIKQRNPRVWSSLFEKGMDWIIQELKRQTEVMERYNLKCERLNWNLLKWILPAIFWYTNRKNNIPQEVMKLKLGLNGHADASTQLERMARLQHQFIQAVYSVQDTEPCSPAVKIILERALANTGELLVYIREKQDEIKIREESVTLVDPSWEDYYQEGIDPFLEAMGE